MHDYCHIADEMNLIRRQIENNEAGDDAVVEKHREKMFGLYSKALKLYNRSKELERLTTRDYSDARSLTSTKLLAGLFGCCTVGLIAAGLQCLNSLLENISTVNIVEPYDLFIAQTLLDTNSTWQSCFT